MANCPECQDPLPPSGLSCPGCGWTKRSAPKGKAKGPPARSEYLRPRTEDVYCRIHKCHLDATGFCAPAQAWWVPRFACPSCHGWLWDNGYCPTCTPKTERFMGDYFEQRWDAAAGRERGHFVRVYRGPTPVATPDEVRNYFAELRAITATLSDRLDANGEGAGRRLRGCGCVRCVQHFAAQPDPEPAWITEDAR